MFSAAQVAELIEQIDCQRSQFGFLTIAELQQLSARGNTILDPFSTLIGSAVQIGAGNLFYPGVLLDARNRGVLWVGDHNRFHMHASIVADAGQVLLGSHNELGDGGVSVKVTQADAMLTIGDHGRYLDGARLVGQNSFGDGAQVLGSITVQNCCLGAGASYQHSDPDLRGGVLKGIGFARGLVVGQGEVINRRSMFEQADLERQVMYHPK